MVALVYVANKKRHVIFFEAYGHQNLIVLMNNYFPQSQMIFRSKGHVKSRDELKMIQLNFYRIYYHQAWEMMTWSAKTPLRSTWLLFQVFLWCPIRNERRIICTSTNTLANRIGKWILKTGKHWCNKSTKSYEI